MSVLNLVLEQVCLYLPLALGIYVSFNLLSVADLSIESAFLMGAVLSWKLSTYMPYNSYFFPLFALVVCLSGALVGVASAFVSQQCKIPQVLSGIITIGVVQGIAYFFLQGAHQTMQITSLPFTVILAGAGILFMGFSLLMYTRLGYAFAMYGNNPSFFTYHRIADGFIYRTGLGISNALAGLSGFLVAQAHGFVDLSMSQGLPLMGLCLLMIGSLVPYSVKRIPLVPLFGTFGYFLLQQALLKAGVTSAYFIVVQSIILLFLPTPLY